MILQGTQLGRCPACKTIFDSDLEQGGNINVVVRRDPATGDLNAWEAGFGSGRISIGHWGLRKAVSSFEKSVW